MADDLDVYVRHQVYVEGYKNGEVQEANASWEEIAAVIALLLMQLGITRIDELSKAQLNNLVRQTQKKVLTIFNKSADKAMRNIRDFMGVEVDVMGKLVGSTTGKPSSTSLINKERMWSSIINDPIGGVGLEPKNVMAMVAAAIAAEVARQLKIGYTEKLTPAELLARFVGTKNKNFKDGLIARLRRQLDTAIETTIQHTASWVHFKVASMFHDRYIWVSVLDSRTTQICRDRNGQIYEFRNGPRPPAHWNCRSTILPISVERPGDLPTFYTWISRQPAPIQDDVLGPARGKELREGRIKSADMPGFDRTRPLTASQYRDKLSRMLQ